MKQLLYAAAAVLLLGQCTSPEQKTEVVNVNFEIETRLIPYALTSEDSVYSAKVSLNSDKDTVVNFVATLDYHGAKYQDSLVFTLSAGQVANGQIIFSECPIIDGEKASLTSTLKPID